MQRRSLPTNLGLVAGLAFRFRELWRSQGMLLARSPSATNSDLPKRRARGLYPVRNPGESIMRTILLCGELFSGTESAARKEQALVIEGERITHVGPIAALPPPAVDDQVI